MMIYVSPAPTVCIRLRAIETSEKVALWFGQLPFRDSGLADL